MALAIGGVVPAGTWARRTWIVDRGFQLKYGIVAALSGAVAMVLLGLWLDRSHDLAMAGLDHVARQAAEASFRILFTAYVGIATAAVAGIGALGALVAHRVAGPAFVMRRYLAAVAAGHHPRVRALRKGDELAGLFAAVEAAVAGVRERDARQLELLERLLAAMRAAVERAPELAGTIALLEAELAGRRAALG